MTHLRRRKFVHTAAALAVTVSVVAYVRMYHILLDTYPSKQVTSTSSSKNDDAQHQQEDLLPPPWSNSPTVEHNKSVPWHRPPLSSLIRDGNVTGRVDFLLDFAIVGHPKTGTTSLTDWLRLHSDIIHMPAKEVHALTQNDPAQMVEVLYDLPPHGLHGYKAPKDLIRPHVLALLARHWPDTKLIVGVRHPVKWFQSFYNFRATMHSLSVLPAPEHLIGACMNMLPPRERKERQRRVGGNDYGLCTDEARFHVHLSRLSTTTTSTSKNNNNASSLSEVPPPSGRLRHRVFLYEQSGQLGDSDAARFELWQQDLWDFLGLTIPRVPYPARESTPPGPLDICLPQYDILRTDLLRHGRDAADWIETHLLHHPDVTVSSPEYFRNRLQTWRFDPCNTVTPDTGDRGTASTRPPSR